MYCIVCNSITATDVLLISTTLGRMQLHGYKSLRQRSYIITCALFILILATTLAACSMLFNSMMVKFSFICTATSLAVVFID